MQRFLIRLFLFALVQVPIVVFVLWRGGPNLENSYYRAIEDKLSRLQNIEGQRTIIIGGSNAAFSIDSEIVAAGLPGEPVNIGLHAGLGLEFYLRMIEDHVRPGDTIIVTPEYELLTRGVDHEIQRQMAVACPDMNRYLFGEANRFSEFKKTLDRDALRHAHEWTYRSFRKQPKSSADKLVYERGSFDRTGDMIAHYSLTPVEKRPFLPIEHWTLEDIQDSVGRLNEFASTCRDAGSQVYFSYPPIDSARYAASQEALTAIDKLLHEHLEIAIIDRPSDHVFAQDEFYDSYYHLSQAAVVTRSQQLNRSLHVRQALQQESDVIHR